MTALFAGLSLFLAAITVRAQDAAAAPTTPNANEARTLWTEGRLIGSPEPPAPYQARRAYPHLSWKSPLYVSREPGSGRLWVVLQGGERDRPSRVVSFPDDPEVRSVDTVLTLSERLIYGLTFHPGYITNHWVFVFSNGPTTGQPRTNRISRLTVSRTSTPTCDPASEKVILEWRSEGHDGGDLAFGPDGMLYLASGDGTSDSDGWNTGQDLSDLLGGILRIDVDRPDPGRSYSVPADNPFLLLPGARPEIWAYGLRNPWRICVDGETGDVWVGNNGQDLWETAHLTRRGDNLGWSVFEGNHPFYLNRRRGPTPPVPPTIEHSHADFRSLTGGVVYRGEQLPELNGTYVYGDYSTGKIWGARHRDGRLTWHQELADTSLQIAAFCMGHRGQLLVVDHGGDLFELIPRAQGDSTPPFPTRLSATGLFEDTRTHKVHPGLISYSVNAPGWADGAEAERYLALPGTARIESTRSRGWNFTDGTALVQTLFLPSSAGDQTAPRRIETRVLLKQQGEWNGYTYLWNDDQSDAELVDKAGTSLSVTVRDASGTPRMKPWRVPSRSECMVCHARAVNYVLGLCDVQMNREHADYPSENQLAVLTRLGAFKEAPRGNFETRDRLVNPYDERADLEHRARSYLHANCSVCHVEAGGGNAQMELEFGQSRERMKVIGQRPQHATFGLRDAMLVAPGAPESSVLLQRISMRGPGQMPPLITLEPDERAVRLFREWIAAMPSTATFVRDWTMADLVPALAKLEPGRPTGAGREVFAKAGCAQCHKLDKDGGTVGPDLSDIGARLTAHQLLEAIVEPSRTVPDAYAMVEVELRNGDVVSGRLESENARDLLLRIAPAFDRVVPIARNEVVERRNSGISNMPEDILNGLKEDEILDLLAYLVSQRGHTR